MRTWTHANGGRTPRDTRYRRHRSPICETIGSSHGRVTIAIAPAATVGNVMACCPCPGCASDSTSEANLSKVKTWLLDDSTGSLFAAGGFRGFRDFF
jgi:hypothetical protein